MPVVFFQKPVFPLLQILSIVALLGIPSITLLPASPTVAQTPTKSVWSRFSSESGGFSLLMPGPPITSNSDGVTSYSVTRTQDSVTYTISYIDFPSPPVQAPNGIQAALAGVKDGITEEGGKIQQTRTINIQGFPGEELRVSMPGESLTRVRSYIVGNRLFLIMASTNNEANLKQSLQGFLDSFRVKPGLIPKASPEVIATPSSFRPKLPPKPETATPPEPNQNPETSVDDDR